MKLFRNKKTKYWVDKECFKQGPRMLVDKNAVTNMLVAIRVSFRPSQPQQQQLFRTYLFGKIKFLNTDPYAQSLKLVVMGRIM